MKRIDSVTDTPASVLVTYGEGFSISDGVNRWGLGNREVFFFPDLADLAWTDGAEFSPFPYEVLE